MHEQEPKRLFEDAAVGSRLRRDLRQVARPRPNPKRRDQAFVRFMASIAGLSTLGAAGSAKAIWWWVAGGAALIAVGATTVAVVTNDAEHAPTEHTAVIAAPTATPAITVPIPEEIPEAEPEVVLAEEPAPRVRRRATAEERVEPTIVEVAPEPPAAPEPEARLARLQRETLLMSEERREAQTGDARRALEIARDAEREFPHGAFAAEREAFAIVALDRLGDHEAVARRGARFLELHPRAPQSAMIRRIMER